MITKLNNYMSDVCWFDPYFSNYYYTSNNKTDLRLYNINSKLNTII